MTQPADKRFVMEDKLTTELALKAPIADPTFTGTVNASIISVVGDIYSTTGSISSASGIGTTAEIISTSNIAITNTSTQHAIQAGPSDGFNVRLGQDGSSAVVQAVNNGAYSTLDVNSLGGNVVLGSASTTTSVLGSFTPPRGYMLAERLKYITTPAPFTKATYPWLRAIRVICVGAGGGGGGAALTAANQNAIGQAGTGGAYAETFITNIAGLAASENLVIGAAGTAGAAGGAGGLGGDTYFGTLCVAKGGGGGGAAGASALSLFGNGVAAFAASSSTGDIVVPGGSSDIRINAYAASVSRPKPGGSFLFPHPQVQPTVTTTTSAGFSPGAGVYGVGGYGGINAQSQAAAVAGGIGSGGFMIVELYA